MKICFISQSIHTCGGVQRVLDCLLNRLVQEKNIEITVLMPIYPDEEKVFIPDSKITIKNMFDFHKHDKRTLKGFLCIGLWLSNRKMGFLESKIGVKIAQRILFSSKQRKEITEYLNQNQFDYVVGVNDYYSLFTAMIANDVNAITFGWMHSSFDVYFKIRGKNSYGLYNLCKEEYKKLQSVIVLTETDKEAFIKNFNVEAVRLYNPVSLYNEEPAADINGPIIFVGRLVEIKGLSYLAKVIKNIILHRPEQLFWILGDGEDRKILEETLVKDEVSANVIFKGSVSDVGKYYQKASVCLHTSCYEGFGLVIVEAMMYGVPVVAFHNTGPDEIINSGENGILIPKFDTDSFAKEVLNLLEDSDKYNRMSCLAHERAKSFLPENIMEELLSTLTRKY